MKTKNQSIYILIITFVIIVGIVIFIIGPVASSVWTSWKDLAQSKTNMQKIDEKKQVVESLKNNKDINKVADIAEKYIPTEEASGQLILDLTAMAQANNLQVEQTSIETAKTAATPEPAETNTSGKATPTPGTSAPTNKPAEAKTVDFTMKLSGSFPDFLNFLKAVETGSRLILIKNISIQQKTGNDQTISFDIQLSGSAYYKTDVSLEENLDNIKITEETLQTFLNLKTYSQPINLPNESGFGRQNPFENY